MTQVPRNYNHDLSFVGVEGSWLHNYGDRLVEEFRYLGYHAVWLSLDTDNPKKKSAQLGHDLRRKEEAVGFENIIRLAHSSGFNHALWDADPSAVIGIQAVASGIYHKNIVGLAGKETANLLADRYTADFQGGIIWPSNDSDYLTQFRRNLAGRVFLDHRDGTSAGVDTTTREMVIRRMRPKLRHPNESELEALPDVELAYFACLLDNAVKYSEFQLPFARHVLGLEPVTLECGHTPMIECPKELAELAVATGLQMKKQNAQRLAG